MQIPLGKALQDVVGLLTFILDMQHHTPQPPGEVPDVQSMRGAHHRSAKDAAFSPGDIDLDSRLFRDLLACTRQGLRTRARGSWRRCHARQPKRAFQYQADIESFMEGMQFLIAVTDRQITQHQTPSGPDRDLLNPAGAVCIADGLPALPPHTARRQGGSILLSQALLSQALLHESAIPWSHG